MLIEISKQNHVIFLSLPTAMKNELQTREYVL
jgi:hypothetical protein